MTPSSVVIRWNGNRGRMELYLPIFFDTAPLVNIRKVLKLLDDHAYQNDTAYETLDQFFPDWERQAKDRLLQCEIYLKTAKLDAEDKRRTVAVMGSALDENIAQAQNRLTEGKRWLAHARKRRNPKADEIGEVKEAIKKLEALLACAMRPKTEHRQAVKEVKRLESAVKTAKAAVERGGKIITAYKAIKALKI